MVHNNISKFIMPILLMAMSIIASYNPFLYVDSYKSYIPKLTALTNDFLKLINRNLIFSNTQILYFIYFFMYALFGMISMYTLRSFSDRIFKNITIPLFIGLATAVVDEYLRINIFNQYKSILIVDSYKWFLLGIFIYSLIRIFKNKNFIFKSIFNIRKSRGYK